MTFFLLRTMFGHVLRVEPSGSWSSVGDATSIAPADCQQDMWGQHLARATEYQVHA